MDLSTRKLNLITYLAQLQDENSFGKIEQYILHNQQLEKKADFKPFSIDELESSVKESEQDYTSGKFMNQDELEQTSEKW
ncbi:hypothetical protein IV494_10920 [Kaistella sp. G5-32]|uniref:Uncharacterized protein n=2 Tax=Kaistella gelatinilytica TaxID=2787636 RepID=A0ABS0FD84_9FLAO|nr:hypothetical protein [Kaistella gelatinilytica]